MDTLYTQQLSKLEKTHEILLDCEEIKPVNPKGNQSRVFIRRTDVEAENSLLWPPDVKNWLIWKPLVLERLKAGGEGDDRGWYGWMASPTRWMWAWASSRRWWWTGKPGVLQSTESERVGHDWASELTDTQQVLVFGIILFLQVAKIIIITNRLSCPYSKWRFLCHFWILPWILNYFFHYFIWDLKWVIRALKSI